MKIGNFTKSENGQFEGQIKTLTLEADISLEPVEKKSSDRAPDFLVLSNGAEVGAAWHDKSERTGKAYISVKIDDPGFAYPLWAAMTQNDEGYQLNWTRPKAKVDPDATSGTDTL